MVASALASFVPEIVVEGLASPGVSVEMGYWLSGKTRLAASRSKAAIIRDPESITKLVCESVESGQSAKEGDSDRIARITIPHICTNTCEFQAPAGGRPRQRKDRSRLPLPI